MASDSKRQAPVAAEDRELRYLIERLLARTSLASEGQDPQLDRVLAELRQYLRGRDRDPGTLRQFQERLDTELERLDDQAMGDAREAGRVLTSLLSAVEESVPFQGVSSELKRLRRQLGPHGVTDNQLLPWLDAFSTLTEQALSAQRQDDSNDRGLWGRLFGRDRTSPPAPSETANDNGSPPSPELDLGEQIMPLTAVAPGTDGEQRLRIARRVGELMDRMVQQVELPPDTHKRALLLKSRLSEQHDWELLRQSLDETADLVIAVVTHSQREFEHFLQRLDERLSSLHGHFSEHADAMAGRRTSAAELEQAVQAQLTELGGSLQSSSDLTELRWSVSHQIDRIARTVMAFREQEEQREQQVSERMDVMREKLVAMEAHSEQIRQQLEQERARALTDILTQLPNREAWEERLRFEYQRWQRYGRPVALAVIDIDHFKRVNDSFGHKAGDRVIQLVARAMAERLRAADFVARYGGEEFGVLLPETDLDQALSLLEDLRTHVANMPFHFQGQPVRVTVSAGLSCFREGAQSEAVFDEADRALYTAKSSGRNQIAVATESRQQ